MISDREKIYDALFQIGAKAPGLVTTSRRARVWSQVPASEQPAFFQQQIKEEVRSTYVRMPHIWTLIVDWIFYIYAGDDQLAVMSSLMNPILDYVDRNFPAPPIRPDQPHMKQTLGGLVVEAKIIGEIRTDEGVLGNQGVAIVPIRILAL